MGSKGMKDNLPLFYRDLNCGVYGLSFAFAVRTLFNAVISANYIINLQQVVKCGGSEGTDYQIILDLRAFAVYTISPFFEGKGGRSVP